MICLDISLRYYGTITEYDVLSKSISLCCQTCSTFEVHLFFKGLSPAEEGFLKFNQHSTTFWKKDFEKGNRICGLY